MAGLLVALLLTTLPVDGGSPEGGAPDAGAPVVVSLEDADLGGLDAALKPLLAASLGAALPSSPKNVLGKFWPGKAHAGQYVVLVSTPSPPMYAVSSTQDYEVLLFDVTDHAVQLRARSGELHSSRDEPTSLDFAPFRLNARETAFAVHLRRSSMYGGGSARAELYELFRVQGAALVPVLLTLMSFEVDLAGEWHDDGTRGHQLTERTMVLDVSKHQTRGFFDWVKRGHGQVTYQWDGERYVPVGKDPMDHAGKFEILDNDRD